MYLFGVHTVDNGGIHMAARRAAAAGARALQLFTAPPRFYGDKASIQPARVERFHAVLAAVGIEPEHVMVHGAYVLNTASPEEEKQARSAAGLRRELERSTMLRAGAVCFHPGSAGSGGDRAAGIGRVAAAITAALRAVDGPTRLLVENTAGAGATIGRTAEEVAAILAAVPRTLRARTGYGLDTCHLFASGYDLRAPAGLAAALDEFEQATGEAPAFFHLNDSEGDLGSNRDRHALIGEGKLGVEPFRRLLADRRSRGVPLILETPEVNVDVAADDPTPDPWDVRMFELLRDLADGQAA
ncbi:MAG TPA: deoxyribonuclease IV [Thermoanaerobaculia bacterium]|jgi:deoxyribonuclease-4|nr:deoxyribonuclease IV [Thermoanaerobaculia bacterium]